MNPEEKSRVEEQITAAIAAHAMWKQRLRIAIQTGATDISVETIRVDNQCVFGKWLYSDSIPPRVKQSPEYQKVLKLHADFHKVAARVAELAISGRAAEAETLMKVNGEYAIASAQLTQAMTDWKKKVAALQTILTP